MRVITRKRIQVIMNPSATPHPHPPPLTRQPFKRGDEGKSGKLKLWLIGLVHTYHWWMQRGTYKGHKTWDDLGKDSAARTKRTLTVMPNAALDFYVLVPGCTFRGGNLSKKNDCFCVSPSMNHLLSMSHQTIWEYTACELHSYTAAAVVAGLAFTGDGLKFTFDLPLPGKRASRKSPNPRKVRKKTHHYHYHSCI